MNDMVDQKQPYREHHMTFLPGNKEPAPGFLVCFWISLRSKEAISFNFLVNVCPCWQTLWMGHFFLPLMALTLDLITVETNQDTYDFRHCILNVSRVTMWILYFKESVSSHLYDEWCQNNFRKEVINLETLQPIRGSPASCNIFFG